MCPHLSAASLGIALEAWVLVLYRSILYFVLLQFQDDVIP